MAASVAAISFAEKLTVKSVDYKDGIAKIQTEAKNKLVAVVQLDRNKKPVQSWTVRTDADGRLAVQANNQRHMGGFEISSFNMPELVAPNNILSGEVFSFAMPNAVEGEVVDVKTVEGEVVASKKTDKLGRILMPLGLAAGAYLITRTGSTKPSQLQVLSTNGQSTGNTQQWADSSQPMHFAGSADCMNMLFSGSPNVTVPVLAASQDEVVCAPPADYGITGGKQSVAMTDKEGQLVSVTNVSMYNLQGVINRSKLMTGEAARLEFKLTPADLNGEITVGVMSGPVRLANGGQVMTVTVEGGKAMVIVQSIPGQTGPFQLGWMFKPGDPKEDPKKDPKQDPKKDEKRDLKGHGPLPPGPFIGPNGDKITPQEQGDGYRRDLEESKDGTTSRIVERWDLNWLARLLLGGGKLERKKVIETTGDTTVITDTWELNGQTTGGTREKTKTEGNKQVPDGDKEVFDPKTGKWKKA